MGRLFASGREVPGMLSTLLKKLLGGDPAWDGSEKRSLLRVKCDVDVEVAMPTLRYLGKAFDISPRGLRVRVRGPWKASAFKAGQPVQIKSLGQSFGSEAQVLASVRWAKREAESQFVFGAVFADPVERLEKTWVKTVLQQNMKAARVSQQRKSVRVRCNLPGKLTVGDQILDVKLRDLSTGGFNVEAFKAVPNEIEVTLQAGPVENLPKLYLKGMVRRISQPLGTYSIGVRFGSQDAATKKVVLDYVRQIHELNKKSKL